MKQSKWHGLHIVFCLCAFVGFWMIVGAIVKTISSDSKAQQPEAIKAPPAVPFDADAMAKVSQWGAPSPAYERIGDFLAAYDPRTRNALWVMERITRQSYQGLGERQNSDFYEDTSVPVEVRASLKDYIGSGYDRGHLASADAHRATQPLIDSTFNLRNVSPQNPSFNRGPWRRLELYCKDMLEREDVEEIWVVTIPMYLPALPEEQGKPENDTVTYKLIGPNHVAVPTHFAKCMLAEFGDKPYIWSYCLPNEVLDLREAWAQQYRIDVDFIEHWSGLDLWNKLPDEVENELESSEKK